MEYFITGIDTDIGKTFVTKILACYFEKQGLRTGVYKPLQSGAIKKGDKLIAPDIEAVKEISATIRTKYSYLLEGEVSPALAARMAGVSINTDKIKKDFKEFAINNDITLVEGAGGILAPVSDNLLCADLIKELNIPTLIVTVPFLGRLNHTLLTVHYAKSKGINIKGIIINKYNKDTQDEASKNFINELKMYTDVEILGVIPDIHNTDDTILKQIFNEVEFSPFFKNKENS